MVIYIKTNNQFIHSTGLSLSAAFVTGGTLPQLMPQNGEFCIPQVPLGPAQSLGVTHHRHAQEPFLNSRRHKGRSYLHTEVGDEG